jgi:hypothetical protein
MAALQTRAAPSPAAECPESDCAVDDGKGSADTDDHERGRIVDTKNFVDLGTWRGNVSFPLQNLAEGQAYRSS